MEFDKLNLGRMDIKGVLNESDVSNKVYLMCEFESCFKQFILHNFFHFIFRI